MSPTLSTSREVESTTLPNGIRVVSEYMPYVRSVAVGMWIGTGSRHETTKENGISHFIEHMLFKGTTHRSAEEIAREVDRTGGHLDAYTAKELASYNTKVLDNHLPEAFDVLADLVLNPVFRAEDIEKEKGVILEELKMEVDNPEYLVHELFSSGFYKGNALGRSILGSKDTIRSFNPDFLRHYYGRYYVPGNMTITAAGRLKHDHLVQLAGEAFVNRAVIGPVEPAVVPKPSAPIILKTKRSLEQCHLVLGLPSYSLTDPRRFANYVLSTVLGGGMSSRLFQNVREKLGLVYSIFSELSLFRDSGMLGVYAGTSVESARQVIDLVLKEFQILKNELVPAEELRRAKDHLQGSIALGLESTSSRMSNLARQTLYYDRFYTIDEMVDSIEQVTAEQVRSIAEDTFHADKIAVTVLGDLGDMQLERADLVC